jgi:CHAT domain-containing protein/Flp pilus assembly protein TadD
VKRHKCKIVRHTFSVDDCRIVALLIAMRLQRISLTALLTLVATLTISDFPLIQNLLPLSKGWKIQNSQVLAQSLDARKAEAKRLNQQGIQQFQTGQFEAALQSWQQALTICREIKDHPGEGKVLGNLGLAYLSLKDYVKAIEYYQQFLAIAQEIKDREGEGAVLGNLGVAYRHLGDYAKTIEYLQKSLTIAREIKNRQSESRALGNLGNTYTSLGEYAKGIDYYQQSLTIAREIQDRQSEGMALGNLGIAYLELGDYAKVIDYEQQWLAIAREIQDRQSEGAALLNLGAAYSSLNGYVKAIDYLQQSLAITKGIQDREGEGKALGNLGSTYLSLGDYAKAIDYLQQSLAITKGIQDRYAEGVVLGNLGVAYGLLGDYGKAIDYQQQNLAIARQIKARDSERIALSNLGLALYKEGNLATAEHTLIDGIKVNESIRAGLRSNDANKVSIFETQTSPYDTLQKVLIAQNKTNAALEIAERGRARAFVELLARRSYSNPTEQPPITPPTIDQIKQIAKAQKATLVQYSIIYDDFNVKGKQQNKESELYIWVINPTGEVTFRSSDLKPLWQQQNILLADLVLSSREAIGVRGRGLEVVAKVDGATPTQRLQQLHQLLIQPIADLLPTDPSARVVLIPQTSLFLVPFPALQDKQGKYLIEKHTILTAPSIQVLELTRQQRERLGAQGVTTLQANDALVVGNPIMPSVLSTTGAKLQQLPSLPGAEQEAKAIAPLLNTKPLIGKDATKIAIEQLMPKARIIHLATHGLLDDVRGIGSAIALAPSGNDDGLLTADQILNLKLNAELVVLSACDTGRGRVTGDGVIGLSRSLISVGVPSVIVSLWSVPDSPTASLMTEFYRQMQQQPDKAQALRSAMLTTMKQYPNPKDWAAFTLIGEAE